MILSCNCALSLEIIETSSSILDSEYARRDSPMLLNKSDESLADKDIPNHSIRDENDNEAEFANSSSRDYPMFFTSFNDTTVLFNTTITGDLDTERDQKNSAVGDWVFKGNKFLEENVSKTLKCIEGNQTSES